MNRDRMRLRARGGPDASWYKIKNLVGDSTEVIIYDEIGYWGVTAADFITELKSITATEISLRINSPGGEIFDGIAIYNTLRSHTARVTTYVDSLAASIASVIAMAGDRIVMQPYSQIMIHDGVSLQFGSAADMREMADMLDKQSDNIAAIYAERAGGTVRQWRARMQAETWYSAAEAAEAGLADEVAKPVRQPDEQEPAMAARWDLSVFAYAGRDKAPAPQLGEQPTPAAPAVSEPVAQAPAAVPAIDPELFRTAMRAAVADPFEFDPDLFRAELELQTSNAPAPPARAADPDPEPDPYDPTVMQRALKEAIK